MNIRTARRSRACMAACAIGASSSTGRVEEVVARVGLQRVHQRLAGVAARVEAARLQHRLRLLLDQRDPQQRLGVGGAREQAEEAALAGHLAVVAERLHPDVVEVRRAVHGGAGVGLGQHQQRLLAGLRLDRVGQPPERLRHLLVGAEDAEAGAGDGAQEVVVALALELVLAVAEEREVLVGQPRQQLGGLADLLGVQRRRVAPQPVDQLGDLGVHLLPVLDRLAHVAQHPLHVVGDLAGSSPSRIRSISTCIQDSRTASPCGSLAPSATGSTCCSAPVMSRTTSKLGWMTRCTSRSWRESSMVSESTRNGMSSIDHLDDGVPAGRPAVLGERRGEDPDLGGALGPVGGQLEVGGEGAVDVDVGAVDHVLGRHVAVVGAEQGVDLVVRWPAGALAVLGHADGLVDQLGLVRILRRR